MFGEETGANFLMKWGQHAKSILEYMKNSRNVKLVELTKEYEGTAKSDGEQVTNMYIKNFHLLLIT